MPEQVCTLCWDRPAGQQVMELPANLCFGCAKLLRRISHYAASVGYALRPAEELRDNLPAALTETALEREWGKQEADAQKATETSKKSPRV